MVFFTYIIHFLVIALTFWFLHKINLSTSKKALVSLVLGFLYATLDLFLFSNYLDDVYKVYYLLGYGYMALLKMMIFPLIVITILSAMTEINKLKTTKHIFIFLWVMIIFVAISFFVTTVAFFLTKIDLSAFLNNSSQDGMAFVNKARETLPSSWVDYLISFVSPNIFFDLTGARPNSLAAVMIFTVFFGLMYLKVVKTDPSLEKFFVPAIQSLQKIIMEMLRFVVKLMPFGLLGLMAIFFLKNSLVQVESILYFVVVCYVIIAIVFLLHLLAVFLFAKEKPISYTKKVWDAVSFAFLGRSSSATIPLMTKAQTEGFGIEPAFASFTSSLGASFAQHGCVGIYPPLLAYIAALASGVDVNLLFSLKLLAVTLVCSIGVVGVGGGAFFASIILFSYMNLPMELIAFLLPVDHIIDAGRTALNVNGTLISSVISNKLGHKE